MYFAQVLGILTRQEAEHGLNGVKAYYCVKFLSDIWKDHTGEIKTQRNWGYTDVIDGGRGEEVAAVFFAAAKSLEENLEKNNESV